MTITCAIEFELLLLDPAIRKSSEKLNELIGDDFIEIGSSGNIYNKSDILKALPGEEIRVFKISDMEAFELSAEIFLVIYTLKEGQKVTKRSSIWKKMGINYQILYHQGTIQGDLSYDK